MSEGNIQPGVTVAVKIRSALLPSLQEMHRVSANSEAMPLPTFCGELIEAAVADYRLANPPRRKRKPKP